MTAEEIRKKFSDQSPALVSAQVLILAEIAAQLAEMNETTSRDPQLRAAVKNLLAKLDQIATDEVVSWEIGSTWSANYAAEFKAVKEILS